MNSIQPSELAALDAVIIDTRTPKEFAEWNIPGAINIPLFSNDERATIGTAFTQNSREAAIALGEEFVRPRIKELLAAYQPYEDKTLVVHCWRGGLRSKAVCELLEKNGFTVFQLRGGIKAHRAMIRKELHSYVFPQKLVVFWGRTGTGKTKLLSHFDNALDLEDLAQHRASVFGAVGKAPRSQKNFENLLLLRLKELEAFDTVLVEGESQKIGSTMIPTNIYEQVLQGTHYLLECPLSLRVKILVDEYAHTSQEELFACLAAIKPRFGQLYAVLYSLLEEKDHASFVKIILEKYYDPLYAHTLKNRIYKEKLFFEDIDAFAEVLREKFPATRQ